MEQQDGYVKNGKKIIRAILMSLSLSSSCNDNKSHVLHVFTRVIYDRVRNRKNYFEIPAFLPIERGISRAGKFKVM